MRLGVNVALLPLYPPSWSPQQKSSSFALTAHDVASPPKSFRAPRNTVFGWSTGTHRPLPSWLGLTPDSPSTDEPQQTTSPSPSSAQPCDDPTRKSRATRGCPCAS